MLSICTSCLGQRTVQAGGHFCFFEVASVHDGNRVDMVRLSRSGVLYWI